MSEVYDPWPKGQAVSFGDIYKLPTYVPPADTGNGGWHGGNGGGGSPPPSGGGGAGTSSGAIFGGGANMGLLPGAPYVAVSQPAGVNTLTAYQIPNMPVLRLDMTIRDLTAGFDLMNAEVNIGQIPNSVQFSTLDINHSRTVCLPSLIDTNSTAANLMSTWKGAMHVAYLKNEFFAPIVGGGSTANKSMFKLDQAASAGTWEEGFTITPQTFTPPSAIVSMSSVRIVTKTPRLIVGFGDDPPKVLTGIDGSPTDSGSMHANLEPCFGVYESALNSTTPGAGTLLFYANNGWWSLSTATSAISDAPTQTLSGINNGGFIVGDAELTGTAFRLFYVEPIEDLGKTHMMDTNAATAGSPSALGKVRSINIEGSDVQDLDVGLDYVLDCKKWRNGLVQTDGQTITWHNGQIVNLGWNRERQWSSDAIVSISGLAVIGERLFAMVVERSTANSTAYLSFDEYVLEENTWVPGFERLSLNNGRFPVFVRETPYIHYFDRSSATPAVHRFFYGVGLTSGDGITQWRAATIWPGSYNPFYSQTTGNMPRSFASTAYADSTIYHMFEGMPKYVSDVRWMGEFKGTNASAVIAIADQLTSSLTFTNAWSATFKSGDRWDKHYAFRTPDVTGPCYDKIQWRLTGNQGTSSPTARTTSNFVPFNIGIYVYLDGQFRPPASLPGEAWRFPSPT